MRKNKLMDAKVNNEGYVDLNRDCIVAYLHTKSMLDEISSRSLVTQNEAYLPIHFNLCHHIRSKSVQKPAPCVSYA